MLPADLIEFLERASAAVASTRDTRLVPAVHFVAGWTIEPDRETLRCLIARGFTGGLLEALRDNGQMAVTAEHVGPHETYQYKGEFLAAGPAGGDDRELFERCRARYVRDVLLAHPGALSAAALTRSFREPELVVRMRVREVFLQTPGPRAGEQVFPGEQR